MNRSETLKGSMWGHHKGDKGLSKGMSGVQYVRDTPCYKSLKLNSICPEAAP